MQLQIEDEVLKKYPLAEIGYLVAEVSVKPTDPFVENLKLSLVESLQQKGINATNFAAHPHLANWRKIYKEDFRVKETTYRSSIESLVKRTITGKGLWNICNVVDLYNSCSILSLLPMGGYDLDKIAGNITLRYAKEGETFQGIGERTKIITEPHHIVYADNQRTICWLWNHKDSEETCIAETTKQVIFFIDSSGVAKSHHMQTALQNLSEKLVQIGGVPKMSGFLNQHSPSIILTLPGCGGSIYDLSQIEVK